MTRPILILDLYCGGGGAGSGLSKHGIVVGIDKNPLCYKYYPGVFVCKNVFELTVEFLRLFTFIWASPPCQEFSQVTKRWKKQDPIKYKHPDLVDPTRQLLIKAGVPWVIENVVGAPLREDLILCGLMFGLGLYRHRIFECSFPITQPIHPVHDGQQPYSVYGNPQSAEMARSWPGQMGIYHINPGSRLFAEAIPPAFSDYIFTQFLSWRALNPIPENKNVQLPSWLENKINKQARLF